MPLLTLKFKNSKIRDYLLQKGLSLTIGGRRNNYVVIDNLAVSGHHAKIDSVGSAFVLIDLQSKNGTFVNGERVTSTKLKDGDQILVGKHTIVFTLSQEEIQTIIADAE